jgi:hypothetical protein
VSIRKLLKNKVKKYSIAIYKEYLKYKYPEYDVYCYTLTLLQDKLMLVELGELKAHSFRCAVPKEDGIYYVRQTVAHNCMTFRKDKPILAILMPSLDGLKELGWSEIYRLFCKDSWKGSTLDPFSIEGKPFIYYKVFR